MIVRNAGPTPPKTPRKKRGQPRSAGTVVPVPAPTSSESLPTIRSDAAGIDVHSDMHVVCVSRDCDPEPVRKFGANTADLRAIAAWLKQCGVKTIAMESTGVYWVPLFEYLESEGFDVHLVEPGQLSRCGARPKTDVLDAQWIQRLHAHGLLRSSFRPPDSIVALRAYWRQRQMLLRYAASHALHMQKALEQMNVKLTEVVSDITGHTGRAIIAAILAGERDPVQLAQLRDPRCRRSEEEIALALEGTWRPEHLFELQQALEAYQFYHQKITECDGRLEAELATLPDRAAEKALSKQPHRNGRKSNDVRFEGREALFHALGVDLTRIEGIEVRTALTILAEMGVDVSRFPTEKHFASWLRLCPPRTRATRRRNAAPCGGPPIA